VRRVLLVGRRRYSLPLDESEARKFRALREVMDVRVLGSGARSDEMFRLVKPFPLARLDGLAFHLALPFRVAREIRAHEPDVVLVQGAHETAAALAGRTLSRRHPRVVLDLHGDWRTATRLYGSRARRLLSPVGDRVAAWAVRRADGVRTVSEFTTRLAREQGVEPTATFAAFMDLDPFLGPPVPLPASPSALFVGALELYKGVDVLAAAWPKVRGAELRVVGKGPRADVIEALGVRHDRELRPDEVAQALDEATCLVLPSRGEGMGRVVVEALLRGRPVVGTRGGGIEDLVRDAENGLLVPQDDPEALAVALQRVLSDRALAERLAAAARPSVEPWVVTPEEYARRLRALIELDSR
jgi:glycosyltransferase involved in cell wall biosynthesis